jgi:fluoride exporter
MTTVISIAVFGAAGCLARYWISSAVNRLMGLGAFPYGTLAVNLIGAFFIGLVMELSLRSTMLSHGMKVALTIGFMGGLTTFSTFSVETFVLIEKGHFFVALMNVLISVTLCLLATWLGIVAVRSV